MIVFKSVEAKNFFSIGENPIKIDLTANKLTLVTGENGAGKTMALVDAISFVLFNRPYRKINKGVIVNTINMKNCLGIVEFDIGKNSYIVKRGIKPDIFEIHKNGKLIDQEASAKDYQNLLEKTILRMNYQSFIQVVIISSAEFDPFMKLEAAKRRAVVEDLLDIEVFSKMNVILKKNIKDLKDDEFKAETVYNALRSQIQTLEENIKAFEQRDEQLKLQKQNEISNYEKKILELKEKIGGKSYTKTIEEAKKIKRQKADGEIKFSIEVQRAKKDLEALNKKIENIKEWCECPECFSAIDDNTRKDIIKRLQDQIDLKETEIGNQDSKVRKFAKELDQVDKILNDLLDKQNSIDSIQNDIHLNENRIENLKIDIERMKKDSGQSLIKNSKEQLKKFLDDYGKQKVLFEEYKRDLEYHEYVAKLLKDNGIKAKIIEQYLPIINKGINHYLDKFNFFVKFELDENFNETIRERHINDRPYNSFSQGEKQRFDLAILFTWRDVAKMKNSLSTNLLIMDEVADNSVDFEGIDNLIEILNEKENINIFVISHRDTSNMPYDKHIKFYKEGNFTKIKEDF